MQARFIAMINCNHVLRGVRVEVLALLLGIRRFCGLETPVIHVFPVLTLVSREHMNTVFIRTPFAARETA